MQSAALVARPKLSPELKLLSSVSLDNLVKLETCETNTGHQRVDHSQTPG